MNTNVVILGGGPGGLAAAWFLKQKGINATILEAGSSVGGLSRSFEWHGFPCDFGSHRFFCADPHIRELVLSLVPMYEHVRRSQVYVQGKWLSDPLNFTEICFRFFPGATFKILRDFLSRPRSLIDQSFEGFVVHKYGRTLCDWFFAPYTAKLMGIPSKDIALSWAEAKVRLAWFSNRFRLQNKKKFSTFHYPINGGYGAISSAMSREVETQVILNARVEAVEYEDGHISQVRYRRDGQEEKLAADAFVSTLPMSVLGRLLGREYRVEYQPMDAVFLLINKPRLSRNHWIYFLDGDAPVNRISERKNFTNQTEPADKTVICAEITTPPAGDLVDAAIRQLAEARLFTPEQVADAKVVSQKHVYPVYSKTYEQEVAAAQENVRQFGNLWSIGRAGEFGVYEVDEVIGSAEKTSAVVSAYFEKQPSNSPSR